MWVSVQYETANSRFSLNSQTSPLIILQTCTPAYTRERGTGHIASANYPVTKRKKKNLLATQVKASTPKENSRTFILARRRKEVSWTSTRKSAVCIDPSL